MGFFKEFKEFAVKGNVMDMAVGVVVGSAFTGIVNSLVKDIIMPPLGAVTGGLQFDALKIVLKEATDTAEAVTLNYGTFIQAVVNFLIIAFSVFCVVKFLNAAKTKLEAKQIAEAEAAKKAEEAEAARLAAEAADKPTTEQLLAEIRDLLKAQK